MTDVDYARLRSLTARRLIRGLERDGFILERQTGAHRQYYHEDGRRVTVSFHGLGETFAPKILRITIEVQAKWTEEDCERLGLL